MSLIAVSVIFFLLLYVFTIILLGFGSSSAFGSSATGASSFGFGTTSKPSGSLSAGWFVSLEFKFILKMLKTNCCTRDTNVLNLACYVTITVTSYVLNTHFQRSFQVVLTVS